MDIDVATCGVISPLNTLDYLIGSFDSDIITMDYRVRGFTRDMDGHKLFLDHDISSIRDFISPEVLACYRAVDMNLPAANLFHTRMMVRQIDVENYLFREDAGQLSRQERWNIERTLRREMLEIFEGSER